MSLSLRGINQPDWQSLIKGLNNADLDSPRRSTVPLLAYWKDPMPRYDWLCSQLGFTKADSVMFSFEYSVDVVRGRGKPSYTDLMILAPSIAIAIEGKCTEPPYEEVETWLDGPNKENRGYVLDGWLDLLRAATGVQLTEQAVLEFPYQLIHRAASACYPSAVNRAMVYQVFSADKRDYYIGNLQKLRGLLPKEALKLAVLETPAIPSDTFAALLTSWDGGKREMAQDVRAELMAGHTFNFSRDTVIEV